MVGCVAPAQPEDSARPGRRDSKISMKHTRTESVSVVSHTPEILVSWLAVFRPCFTAPVWNHILVLVAGAILAPGKRTVTQALRVMGLADRPGFGRYHEVLNRARWDARDIARRLLRHLLAVLWPDGEVVIAIDDTIERRWGAKIKARGIYRDPVRSSDGLFVKTESGLRLVIFGGGAAGSFRETWKITGYLPFLTVLAPSATVERDARQAAQNPRPIGPVRPYYKANDGWPIEVWCVVVADSSFAALELIAAVRRHVCLITRLRLDASLFEPAPERRPNQKGRPRLKGKALPKLSTILAGVRKPSGPGSR